MRRRTHVHIISRQAEHRIDVASVEGVQDRPHNLHVLLRHRLLAQPGGFEGFGLTAAGAPPNDSLVTPLGEYPAHLLDHGRGAVHAVRPMRADARGAERPVAKLANLIEAEAEVRKGTEEVLPPLPHAVVSVIVATDSGEQWLDLAIRVVNATNASRSRRTKASKTRRVNSTFSCDIAYSRSPTASRAPDQLRWNVMRTILPPRS